MPHPVQSHSRSSDAAGGYYDADAGQCVSVEPAASMCRKPEAPPAAESCASEPGMTPEAVEHLVERLVEARMRKTAPESCVLKAVGTGLKCAATAVGVVALPATGPAAVITALNAGECVVGVAETYNCVTRSE